jgi:Tfp pilus assembly protein PilO
MSWRRLCRNDWRLSVSLAMLGIVCPSVVWLHGGDGVKAVRARVDAKQPLALENDKLAAELLNCERKLETAEASLAEWERASPERRHTCRLWQQIDAAAADAGMTVTRFAAESPIVHEQMEEIPVAVRGSGDLPQVAEFVQSMERLPATIWIESVRVRKSDGNAKPAICELNLTILGRSW